MIKLSDILANAIQTLTAARTEAVKLEGGTVSARAVVAPPVKSAIAVKAPAKELKSPPKITKK